MVAQTAEAAEAAERLLRLPNLLTARPAAIARGDALPAVYVEVRRSIGWNAPSLAIRNVAFGLRRGGAHPAVLAVGRMGSARR